MVFGLGSVGQLGHYYQLNSVLKTGNLDSSWTFNIDTVSATSTRARAQGVLVLENTNYIAGLAVGEQGGKVFGTLVQFNDVFTDTIMTVAYDLSMDTRMHILIKTTRETWLLGENRN